MKRTLVWFKTDLRLHDNETLVHAIAHSDDILPVYCIDPRQFETNAFGFQKTGKFRAQFLLESLADLDKNLRALGSGLLVVRGLPEEELLALVKQYAIHKVVAKKEVAYEELQLHDTVEKALWTVQCPIETYSSSTLYHAQDLPFALKDIPDVFTNFRKRLEKEVNIRAAFETPKVIHSPEIPPLQLPTLADLNLEPIKPDKRAAYNLKGGETAALKRLQHYLYGTLALSTYKDTRNGLIGDAYSTKFSAHLSLGCVSARSIYYAVKKYELQHGANESTYWLIFELMWRDYFRFMMKKYRQKFFLQNGIQTTKDNLQNHDAVLFAKWQNAATGNAFIDANIRELNSTGFMSNRGRQNVASYLHNDLKLDWRYGAAYFEQQLIDYDVCSNWGNWAYLAGVGNDPRGQRTFNTEKQALDYDKDGAYRKLWSK
jgi:deoxyribodipyrimidine photo-lyase